VLLSDVVIRVLGGETDLNVGILLLIDWSLVKHDVVVLKETGSQIES